jgi:DNA-binding NtrC family response regulator
MQDLMAYSWPGNVRELEHLVERSVLLATGATLKNIHLPILQRKETAELLDLEYTKTIEENERDHIMKVLDKCNGKIFGRHGAAALLGIPVSTLNSKIKKLGIKKESPKFINKS